MKIELSESQEAAIIREAAANLASRIQSAYGCDALLDAVQVAQKMNVSKGTVARLKIPRVVVCKGAIRYRLSEVEKFITKNSEK